MNSELTMKNWHYNKNWEYNIGIAYENECYI